MKINWTFDDDDTAVVVVSSVVCIGTDVDYY